MDMRLGLVSILLFANSNTMADSTNPFQNETVIQTGRQEGSPPSGGSALAGSIFNSKRADENTIGPVQSGGDGRQNKAGESKNTAGTGSGVAIATGATLIGMGIPMSLVPEIVTSVAGIQLISMGAMELAQGIASAGSQDNNRTAERVAGQTGDAAARTLPTNSAQAEAAAKAKEALLSPQMRSALEKNGTDPEEFANQMLSNNGAGATVENVAQAFGIPAASLAEGRSDGSDALVANELNRLQAFGGNNFDGTDASGGSVGSGSLTASGSASDPGVSEAITAIQGSSGVAGSIAHSSAVDSSKEAGSTNGKDAASAKDFLAGLFPQGVLESGAMPTKLELAGIGVLSPPKGRNIFQVARSEYHTFGKWRRGSKVASK